MKVSNKYNNVISLIITLSLFSIPGVLYLGISYEQALWSMICFSIVLIEINKENINYKKIILIILFFSFFRILSLAAILILGLNIFYKAKSIKIFLIETKLLIKNSYPLLILIPFLLFSFFDKSSLTVDRLGFQFLDYNFLTSDLHKMIFHSYNYVVTFLIYFRK